MGGCCVVSDKLFILLAKTSTVKKILELETKILELGKYHPVAREKILINYFSSS